MDRKKVVIIHSNALALNVRGFKEIEANNDLYDFVFLGWNRNNTHLEKFKNPLNSEINLLNIKAPYGKLYLMVMTFWWIYIFLWLMVKKWDMVHVINLDSALPALIASKLKGKKSIYEILDTYEDSVDLPPKLRKIIINFDKILISHFNAVIIVDEEQIEEFENIPNNNTVIVYDSPPETFHKVSKEKNAKFCIFHAGNLHKDRKLNLDKLLNVLYELDDIQLVIAGYGDEDTIEGIKRYQKDMPDKVSFIGQISYEDVIKYSCKADMLFQFRDSSLKINKYICGSTLFNSMASGTPIIVNKGSSTANKVLKENCGLVVDVYNPDEVKDAILRLKNNEILKNELSSNARKAYENKYNWKIMEKRLKNLYNELI